MTTINHFNFFLLEFHYLMDKANTFEEIIDSIEPTSSGSISQYALEPGTLIVTNHPPKRVKKDPFWNELTEVGDNDIATFAIKRTEQRNVFESKKYNQSNT